MKEAMKNKQIILKMFASLLTNNFYFKKLL